MKEGSERKKRRIVVHAAVLRQGARDDAAAERVGKSTYEIYDSPAQDFDEFFGEVLAPYATIRDYAEAHYGARKGELVAAEFGGSARKLFGDLNQDGSFRHTVGFVLHDSRSKQERLVDLQRGHDVVEADVFFKDGARGISWHTVEEWTQDNGKPNIIIERMVQGIDLLRSADLYVAVVKRWLSQLAPGGTLLAEISHKMPLDERKRLPTLLEDLEVDEVIFNPELTNILVRTYE